MSEDARLDALIMRLRPDGAGDGGPGRGGTGVAVSVTCPRCGEEFDSKDPELPCDCDIFDGVALLDALKVFTRRRDILRAVAFWRSRTPERRGFAMESCPVCHKLFWCPYPCSGPQTCDECKRPRKPGGGSLPYAERMARSREYDRRRSAIEDTIKREPTLTAAGLKLGITVSQLSYLRKRWTKADSKRPAQPVVDQATCKHHYVLDAKGNGKCRLCDKPHPTQPSSALTIT